MNCKYCRANCTGAKQDRKIALCLGYDPPKTNADRLRSMTDEELAEWIRDQIIDRNIGIPSETWLDWLRQEARDGET